MNNRKITQQIKKLDANNIDSRVKKQWIETYGEADYCETLECIAAINLIMNSGNTYKLLLLLKQNFEKTFTEEIPDG